MKISQKVNQIEPSATLAISARAKTMKKNGLNVLSFSAGEPDFDTPQCIKDAAKLAIDQGFTKYTPTSGIIELKEAICYKLNKENGLAYHPDEVIVSCGAKHSLFNAILTLCDTDDEVLLPVLPLTLPHLSNRGKILHDRRKAETLLILLFSGSRSPWQ